MGVTIFYFCFHKSLQKMKQSRFLSGKIRTSEIDLSLLKWSKCRSFNSAPSHSQMVTSINPKSLQNSDGVRYREIYLHLSNSQLQFPALLVNATYDYGSNDTKLSLFF